MNGDPDPQQDIYGFPQKYRDNQKSSDIMFPPATQAMTFIDEEEFSIDDGYFGLPAEGDNWGNVPASVTARVSSFVLRTATANTGAGMGCQSR
jgi:hypothetical protein